MIKKAGNGRLGKRKTPADVIHIHGQTYVQDDNDELIPYVPPPPAPSRRFTEQDRKRANKNRDRRHSCIWYTQQLLAVAEGKLILTKEQYHALVTLGRLKAWNRRPPFQR
jgi:hypothetical protein